MSENHFETAEVGDWFYKENGMTDYYKVVDIEETFGDRVKIVLETRDISTRTDTDTHQVSEKEPGFNREYEPVDPEEIGA